MFAHPSRSKTVFIPKEHSYSENVKEQQQKKLPELIGSFHKITEYSVNKKKINGFSTLAMPSRI